MSARTAAATPGYWTLTATVAAVVQPGAVDLADRGGGDRRLRRTPRSVSPSARRARTRSPCACRVKRTFGAASRSSASLRWNSSRCSSGTSPTSRKLITCPSFIAAPFIVPSAVTICSAASTWRRSSAARLPSSRRARGSSRACRGGAPPGPPRGSETFAVREIREVGIWSLAIRAPRASARRGGWSSRAVVRGRRRRRAAASRSASAVAVGVGVGVSVASGVGVRRCRRRLVLGGRRRRRRRLLVVRGCRCCRRSTLVRRSALPIRVAEDGELGGGHHDRADHRGQQPGDDARASSGKTRRRLRSGSRRPNGSSVVPPGSTSIRLLRRARRPRAAARAAHRGARGASGA